MVRSHACLLSFPAQPDLVLISRNIESLEVSLARVLFWQMLKGFIAMQTSLYIRK